MSLLFRGPYIDYLRSRPPLLSAEYFGHGSSTTLFCSEGRLYRLTRQGCGHNFVSRQSASGNPHVPRVIKDFGPVAPSDEDKEDFYWLAQVERLQDLDPANAVTQKLITLLVELTDDEPQIYGEELQQFGFRCLQRSNEEPELRGLLTTLATMAAFASEHGAEADIKLDNIMLRPGTNELVLADPVCDTYFEIDGAQRERMDQIRAYVLDEISSRT
ncbi:hypothetical protein [Pseudomonas sp. PS02303]|uniref:hypothetical protein n=1 Tax=Pseudomonas sp. PS02303 TaxID=2991429 RepID=UPI00249BEAB4|nr:hypothetical protein [Pseudomonas sp. PS02303]